MPHKTEEVVGSLLEVFTDEQKYPGVREHFSTYELAHLDALATKRPVTAHDKGFLLAMIAKLLFLAD